MQYAAITKVPMHETQASVPFLCYCWNVQVASGFNMHTLFTVHNFFNYYYYYYYYYYYVHVHVIESQLYRNKSALNIIHKLSWVQYIIMHEYKLNCLIVDSKSCTQKFKWLPFSSFSLLFFIVLFFLMSVSLPFVNSVQFYS